MKVGHAIVVIMIAIMTTPVASDAQHTANAQQHRVLQVTPAPSPRVVRLAKEWFYRIQTGHVDRSQLDAVTNLELTADVIKRWSASLTAFGAPRSFEFTGTGPVQYAVGYSFLITFERGEVVELIAVDYWGKIAGLDFERYVPNR